MPDGFLLLRRSATPAPRVLLPVAGGLAALRYISDARRRIRYDQADSQAALEPEAEPSSLGKLR
jgi:hypothetical protein